MRRLLLTLTALLALATPAEASWTWPVRGDVITPYRNGSDPYAAGQHRGIDIGAPVGTPVVAAAAGDVLFAGTAGSSGLTVSVRTINGFDTSYLHLSARAVRAGSHVAAGERLGAVGTTGTRSATQPHLHFGVREAGTRHGYLDPLSFLPPPTAPPPAEAPQPAPAPAPAPLAPTPAPAPRPAPGRARRPVPAPGPAPRRSPAPRRGRRPAPVPPRVPRLAPAPTRAPLAGRATSPAPAPSTVTGRVPASALRPTPEPDAPASHLRPGEPAPTQRSPVAASSGRAPARSSSEPDLRASGHAEAPPSSSGPDIGWALACAGLLLAAGILGLTDDGRKASARSRARLARTLRPLLGRR